jgi:hypothetical protein
MSSESLCMRPRKSLTLVARTLSVFIECRAVRGSADFLQALTS